MTRSASRNSVSASLPSVGWCAIPTLSEIKSSLQTRRPYAPTQRFAYLCRKRLLYLLCEARARTLGQPRAHGSNRRFVEVRLIHTDPTEKRSSPSIKLIVPATRFDTR